MDEYPRELNIAELKDFERVMLVGNDYDYGLKKLCGIGDNDHVVDFVLPEGYWLSINSDIGPAVGTKATIHKGAPRRTEVMMPVAVGPCVIDAHRLEALVALFEAYDHVSDLGMVKPALDAMEEWHKAEYGEAPAEPLPAFTAFLADQEE